MLYGEMHVQLNMCYLKHFIEQVYAKMWHHTLPFLKVAA